MKKLAIVIAIFIIVIVAIGFNLSRASQEPLITTPDPLQVGRGKLHAQLVQSEQREAVIEKQDWNSIPLLRELVLAHQTRIQKLAGNSEAVEIIAHDQDAIARLEKRIQELTAIESAKPPAGNGKGD
jgi:hypothetical protein